MRSDVVARRQQRCAPKIIIDDGGGGSGGSGSARISGQGALASASAGITVLRVRVDGSVAALAESGRI